MDATVRNAKVNMRRSGVKKGRRGRGRKKKRGEDFRISKVLPPVSSSVQSDLASLCNNIQSGGQLLRVRRSLAAADLSRKREGKKRRKAGHEGAGEEGLCDA